jgi:hypothetical protein
MRDREIKLKSIHTSFRSETSKLSLVVLDKTLHIHITQSHYTIKLHKSITQKYYLV